MYIVGQNNPQVGNDRRQQLLQQLVQQAMQNAGGVQQTGDQGFTSLQQLMARRRQQQAHTPSQAASRAAGAGRATAGTSLLNAQPLPTGLAARMGIGGGTGHFSGTADAIAQPGHMSGRSVLSPGAGNPINPNIARITGNQTNPNAQGLDTAMQNARYPDPIPNQQAPALTTQPNGQVTNMATLVPLGNGMYLDPNTGDIRGGGVLPMGGGPRLIGPDVSSRGGTR